MEGSERKTLRLRTGKLVVGSALVLVGLVIVIAVGIYYTLGRYNSTQLEDLKSAAPGPIAMEVVPTEVPQVRGALMPDGSFKPIQTAAKEIQVRVGEQANGDRVPASKPATPVAVVFAVEAEPTASAAPDLAQSAIAEDASDPSDHPEELSGAGLVYAYNAIYPGYQIHPKYWDQPLTAGADLYAYGAVLRPDGYVSIDSSQGMPRGTAPDASHIRIPSIGVDSAVSNLAIIDIGDSRQYETPKHVVGRIPETSNPGEQGNTWLFGHLESPIRGEGNVFQKLPEIPALVNSGDPVYVSLLNEDGDEFLYQITETEVVHQDEIQLYQTKESTITLVSCVPRLVYDHRLLVVGKLVGVKKAT
ncbi:MAG: sortase [Dehalococcoidia bacterium]|nr:sortase [Dehalococcoidia bacterium]